jgi:ribonucleoside-diphosphate reductase alpha chain
MTARERLPDRRGHELVKLEHGGFRLSVGVGRYADGRLGEIFIDTHKGGSAIDTTLRDCAVLLSIALQHGANASAVRKALSSTGAIGAVLDKIAEGCS